MGEAGRDGETAREVPPPRRGVGAHQPLLRRFASRRVGDVAAMRRHQLGQQPCRLQRHADPFADDRVRLAGGVADAKDRVVAAHANAGAKRPAGEPGALAGRAVERNCHASAFAPQHRFEHVAGARAGQRLAQGVQPIFANAAGQGRNAVVGHHHAPVAAVERGARAADRLRSRRRESWP